MQQFTACSALQCNIDAVYYCAVLSKVHFKILNCTYIICVVRVKLQKKCKDCTKQETVCWLQCSEVIWPSPQSPRPQTPDLGVPQFFVTDMINQYVAQ